jgi:hypothetical protein
MGQCLNERLQALQKVCGGDASYRPTREERDEALADALAVLPAMLEGPKQLRPGGAQPLVDQLFSMLAAEVDEVKDSTCDPGSKVARASDLVELLKLVPGSEDLVAKTTAFKCSIQEVHAVSSLDAAVERDEFDRQAAVSLLTALRQMEGAEVTPAMAKKIVDCRMKLCKGMAKDIAALNDNPTAATPDSLDPYLKAWTQAARFPEVVQLSGGEGVDKAARAAVDTVPSACLQVFITPTRMQADIEAKKPHIDALEALTAAADKVAKFSQKYKGVGNLSAELHAIIRGCLDNTSTRAACDLISEYGLKEIQQLTGLLRNKVKGIVQHAGGHPAGNGRLWSEGLKKVVVEGKH